MRNSWQFAVIAFMLSGGSLSHAAAQLRPSDASVASHGEISNESRGEVFASEELTTDLNLENCDDRECGERIGCGDCVSCELNRCGDETVIYAGVEATFLQPRFDNNTAFTILNSDGTSFESLTDVEFDYGLEVSPRAFLGIASADGIGLRTTWWQFDHGATQAIASPPANGFGRITPPPFGDVDISTTIPGDTFSAATGLNANTVDLEFTKIAAFSAWKIGVACGARYATIEQTYFAATTDSGSDLRGQIDFQHQIEGIGPTVGLWGSLSLWRELDLFGSSRGSLLFGDSKSRQTAGEDLDLSTSFITTRNTSRDDLLPIAELQLGVQWTGDDVRGRSWRPSATIAMEGQFWGGAGNAASEDGNLGFFGLAGGVGITW